MARKSGPMKSSTAHQVKILNEHQPLSDMQFEKAIQTVTSVILRGIGLEP
jgi:TetR/AcrR family transcriptional regulator